MCNVILDGGSSENIISKEAVEKLKLPIEKHANPYKVTWFRKGSEDACHILLGRPWLFDKDMMHSTKANTYSFYKDGRKWTLQPLEEGFCHVPKDEGLMDVEGASNKLEDDNLLNLEKPPVFDYCLEEDCEVCLGIEKAFDKVFGESKQAESSVILKAVNHEEVGFELLKQHNQPMFEGKVIQEILEGIVGDEMNSFEGDTYEYADFLGVDSFNLQTTKTIIDLVRLLVFGVKSFWVENLAAEDILYCSRRIKYSKYLFLWSGKVQYQGQSSMENLSKRRLCLGGFHQTIGIPVRILPNPMELMQEHLLDFPNLTGHQPIRLSV
ncbi:unnamed protein product [Prunus armeniaca]